MKGTISRTGRSLFGNGSAPAWAQNAEKASMASTGAARRKIELPISTSPRGSFTDHRLLAPGRGRPHPAPAFQAQRIYHEMNGQSFNLCTPSHPARGRWQRRTAPWLRAAGRMENREPACCVPRPGLPGRPRRGIRSISMPSDASKIGPAMCIQLFSAFLVPRMAVWLPARVWRRWPWRAP